MYLALPLVVELVNSSLFSYCTIWLALIKRTIEIIEINSREKPLDFVLVTGSWRRLEAYARAAWWDTCTWGCLLHDDSFEYHLQSLPRQRILIVKMCLLSQETKCYRRCMAWVSYWWLCLWAVCHDIRTDVRDFPATLWCGRSTVKNPTAHFSLCERPLHYYCCIILSLLSYLYI
jgi:hypothetical protein